MRSALKVWGCIFNRFFCSKKQQNVKSVSISNVYSNENIDTQIVVKGWVKALRSMKSNIFFDVDDGSNVNNLQIVMPKDQKPRNLSYGSSVKVEGLLKSNSSNEGKLEVLASKVEVIGSCDVQNGYPFVPRKKYPPDYIRQFLHFRSRTSSFASLLRIRNAASLAIHNFFNSKGFILIHTPILTSNDCEGAGEVFIVKPQNDNLLTEMAKLNIPKDEAFFDTKAFLTVSGQLHAECIARGISQVYTFGPTFRAENSRTRLHLSEFYMIEPEIAFVDSLQDILQLMEELIKDTTSLLLNKNTEDIESIYKSHELKQMESISKILNNPFGIMTYEEAFSIICNNAHKFKSIPRKEDGLNKEHELFLVSHNNGCPVFVINWPKEMKPFYMKELEDDSSKVAAVDLLVPNVGELCGGSLRVSDPCLLEKRLLSLGMEEHMRWYVDMRRFGNVPTGGFGMGFERFLQMLLAISNIKDVIPFPRWSHNCKM